MMRLDEIRSHEIWGARAARPVFADLEATLAGFDAHVDDRPGCARRNPMRSPVNRDVVVSSPASERQSQRSRTIREDEAAEQSRTCRAALYPNRP
jgi:hypothetical protein